MNTIEIKLLTDHLEDLAYDVIEELGLDRISNRFLLAFSDNLEMHLKSVNLIQSTISIEELLQEIHAIAIDCGGNQVGSNGLQLFRRFVQVLRAFLVENVNHGGSAI